MGYKDNSITQLQVVFSKDFETKAGKLYLSFFTIVTVIKITLAIYIFLKFTCYPYPCILERL